MLTVVKWGLVGLIVWGSIEAFIADRRGNQHKQLVWLLFVAIDIGLLNLITRG